MLVIFEQLLIWSVGPWRDVWYGQERGDIIVDENYMAVKLQGQWGWRGRHDNMLHCDLDDKGAFRFKAFKGLNGKAVFRGGRLAEIHCSNGAVWKKLEEDSHEQWRFAVLRIWKELWKTLTKTLTNWIKLLRVWGRKPHGKCLKDVLAFS